MIKAYRDIIGLPVLRFDDGALVAAVKDVIIHPDTGKIEALWVRPANHPVDYAVIQTQDIVQWKQKLYVKNEDTVADPADIIKIAEILSDGRQIIGGEVRTDAGEVLGRVSDIDFDSDKYYLRHLHTEKRFFGFFSYDRRILPYESILEVLPTHILVKDRTKQKEAAKEPILPKEQALQGS